MLLGILKRNLNSNEFLTVRKQCQDRSPKQKSSPRGFDEIKKAASR